MFLTQGVPPPDNYPSCWGRLPCHHVELQEVQRLIHGAIRELLQDVNRNIHKKRKHRLSDSWFQSEPWSIISKDIINWKLISCNSLKETNFALDMYRESKFCGEYIYPPFTGTIVYIIWKSCNIIYIMLEDALPLSQEICVSIPNFPSDERLLEDGNTSIGRTSGSGCRWLHLWWSMNC